MHNATLNGSKGNMQLKIDNTTDHTAQSQPIAYHCVFDNCDEHYTPFTAPQLQSYSSERNNV